MLNTILQALKSRTVVFGIAVLVLGNASAYVGVVLKNPLHQMLASSVIGGLIILFRYLTTVPVEQK